MARTSTKTKNNFESFMTELGFQRNITQENTLQHFYKKNNGDARIYCVEYDISARQFRTAYHKDSEDYMCYGWNNLKFSEWTYYDETVMMVDEVLLYGMGDRDAYKELDIDTITDVENGNIINRVYGTGNHIAYSIENLEKKAKDVYFLFDGEDTINEAVRIYRPDKYPTFQINSFTVQTESAKQMLEKIIVMDMGAFAQETGKNSMSGNMFQVFPHENVSAYQLQQTVSDPIPQIKGMVLGLFVLKTKLGAGEKITLQIILK